MKPAPYASDWPSGENAIAQIETGIMLLKARPAYWLVIAFCQRFVRPASLRFWDRSGTARRVPTKTMTAIAALFILRRLYNLTRPCTPITALFIAHPELLIRLR